MVKLFDLVTIAGFLSGKPADVIDANVASASSVLPSDEGALDEESTPNTIEVSDSLSRPTPGTDEPL